MSWLVKLDMNLIWQIIIQAGTFLVFFIVVKVFFADKIKKIMSERQDAIEKEIDEAVEANQNAHELEEKYNVLLKDAKNERASILRDAENEGEKLRGEIVANAGVEAREMLQNAKKQIEYEREQAEREMKNSIVDIAITAAETISGKALTEEDQQRLIDEAINSIGEV